MKALRKERSKPAFRSIVGRAPNIVIHESISDCEVIAAGKFKATCLQLLDRAAEGESIAITKRGKVVARLVPPEEVAEKPFVPLWGRMRGKGKVVGDIVGPDFEAWGMKDPIKKK